MPINFNSIKINRRDLLKTSLFSGIALISSGVYKFLDQINEKIISATEGIGPFYYGTDSANATVIKSDGIPLLPQNFYIGRTGVGEVIYDETDPNFNQSAALAAGFTFSHTYWVIKGPFYYWRQGRDYRKYGWDQGVTATNAWFNHPNSNLFFGETIFGDVEGTMNEADHQNRDRDDGWTDHYHYGYYQNPGYVDVEKNRLVIEGFLDAVWNYHQVSFKPGIYTTKNLWNEWFGDKYIPPFSFVVWLAGGDHSCPSCEPCNSACDTRTEVDYWFTFVRNSQFGIMRIVIWQYYLSPGCGTFCGDFNISSQNGEYWFHPEAAPIYLPITMNNQERIIENTITDGYPVPANDNTEKNGSLESSYPAP